MFWATWPSLVQHTRGTMWCKRKATISLPTPLQKRAPPSKGRSRPVSSGNAAPAPRKPLLPGPAPHMGIIMLQQPGHPPTFLWWGQGWGQGRPRDKVGETDQGKYKVALMNIFLSPPFSPLKSKLMLLLLHGWLHFMTHTVQTITAPGGRGYRAIHSWGGGALNSHPRALTSRNAWMKGQESEGAPWHTAHKEAHREPPRGHLVGGD